MSHLTKIKQLIDDACEYSDLDDSVRLIQDFIDQGDGMNASMFFSGSPAEAQWSVLDRDTKKAILLDYLYHEYKMAM
jgi:hypothetical protein